MVFGKLPNVPMSSIQMFRNGILTVWAIIQELALKAGHRGPVGLCTYINPGG